MNITNIPAPRVDFVDPRTGLMSREWYLFFLNLFNLVGAGTNAMSLTDLQIMPIAERYDDVLAKIEDNQTLPVYQQPQADKYNRVMAWLSTPT
jgi:hypothetical protein